MVMKRYVSVLAAFLCLATAQAQHATIVEDITTIDYKSTTDCTTRYKQTFVIHDERGLSCADFVCSCDKASTLSSFAGVIKYANGKEKKLKKSDLTRSEYSSNFDTDSYMYVYSPSAASYPVTISYEWTQKDDGQILHLPLFAPQPSTDVDVKKAEYTIHCPENVTIHHYLRNIDEAVVKESAGNGIRTISVSMSDLPVVKRERFMPSLSDVVPMAYFIPDTFSFGKTNGSLSTWESFGEWLHELQTGRDELPQALKLKLHQFTDAQEDLRTKVLIVYRMLEETTRYISIQLGIGGMQPFPATYVATNGFGDCKALSNYMISMLREIGISADYVVISTRNKDLPTDFACPGMLNHAIARVNIPNDTLWVECTNPKLPLGYLHDGIAGHEALLVDADGGRKVRLPNYTAQENADSISLRINLAEDGSAQMMLHDAMYNSMFEDVYGLTTLDSNKQRDKLRSMLSLSDFDFSNHSISQRMDQSQIRDERRPVIDVDVEGVCKKFSNKTGKRMFLNLFPIIGMSRINTTSTREAPVQLRRYENTRVMHVETVIPDNYRVESLPEALEEISKFGTFRSTINVVGNIISADFTLNFSTDTFPAADYKAACAFCNKISEFLANKVVLTECEQIIY